MAVNTNEQVLLKNPHSLLEVFKSRPQDVLEVQLPNTSRLEPAWEQIESLAQKHRTPIKRESGTKVSSQKEGRQGLAQARVRAKKEEALEDILPRTTVQKGLWLALDCLQDPHNVGAVFRTAAFFGVKGILLTEERSSPMSGTVYDVASGGVEVVPYCRPGNLVRAFELVKERGLWILGSSERGAENYRSIPLDRPWLLVLGNEEKGIRRLTEENCDLICRISGDEKSSVISLNVSVAAGVLISQLTLGNPVG